MTKFIDFVPKRPEAPITRHPVAKKPIKPAPDKPLTEKSEPKKVILKHSAPEPKKPALEHSAPGPRPTPKPSMKRTVRRMDFVRRPASAPLPEVKVQKKTVKISVSAHSAPMPELRSAPAPRPISRPMPKMKPATNMKPAANPRRIIVPGVDLTTKPTTRIKATAPTEPHDVKLREIESHDTELHDIDPHDVEPLATDDELSLALAGFADDDASTPSLIDNLSKEATDLEDELDALDELDAISDDLEAEIADFVEEPKPMFAEKKPDAPDANKYRLGGRSPFLSSVRVEKRPLSSFVPDSTRTLKSEAKTPVKNSYHAKIKQVVDKVKDEKVSNQPLRRRETTIIATPKNHANGIGLSIAIILTIVLGAAIGAVLYLVFFQ